MSSLIPTACAFCRCGVGNRYERGECSGDFGFGFWLWIWRSMGLPMGTWVGSGPYLEEIFQHRGRYAAVALSLRRRGRVQRARLRTAEREGFIDSRERPDTAPPDPTPVVGHGPFPPEAAVLAGLDPAEERGGSSHPPRGDAVIGLGASQRERAGRGRAGTAPQHERHLFHRLAPRIGAHSSETG